MTHLLFCIIDWHSHTIPAMYPKPRPPPSQQGPLFEAVPYSSYSPYNHNIPVSLPYDLTRLHQEKDFLSMRLADSVTYLKALREKQVRSDRQLNVESALPRKKRKRQQQVKRHLDSEIRNRERDEQAYLNNLQACETNIILANMKAQHLANASFHTSQSTLTPTLYTPTLYSYSGSEATDLSWDGWTDEAVVSAFQKRASNPFFLEDPAPDVCTEGLRCDSAIRKDVRRPPPLSQDAAELSNSLPVPPNTAQPQFRRSSILSPEAIAFQPVQALGVQNDDWVKTKSKRLSMSSATATKAKEILQQRRFSAAEIDPILQRFSVVVQPSPRPLLGELWCKATPQQNPQKDVGMQLDRERTNSL